MHRVSKELVLYGLTINRRHFEAIIHNTSHLERLEFYICKIDSEGLRFRTDLDYKVKVLSFISSGEVSNSNWLVHPVRFEYILNAIANCSLKTSLQLIDIKWCFIHQDNAENMFLKHNLRNIKVFGLYDKNYKIYSFIL
ncbi:unnamed protein product [Moneuplotes crassus]|uniref:Uncharacterized protein n=1 Tax=Euplotes crassus TaxID=5936 RepID=A0AAD1XRY6_EUPCR|nr:unnamed protein product [Moneuplotes crassus]